MRDPDHAKGAVQVWHLRPLDPPLRPDHAAGLSSWLVNGPFHPFWSWWHVSVVHLRDLPGVPPAKKHYPEAQYEFTIVSVDPDRPIDVDTIESGKAGIAHLEPPDAVIQFHGITDDEAKQVCDLAVALMVNGASPDVDFRSLWEHAIADTVEHFRTGGLHVPDGRA